MMKSKVVYRKVKVNSCASFSNIQHWDGQLNENVDDVQHSNEHLIVTNYNFFFVWNNAN